MKHINILLLLHFFYVASYSQDCKDYWNQNSGTDVNNGYTIVPSACISKLIATDESMEIPFELIQNKDYKMSIFTTFKYKAYITLYDKNNGKLIYNNILNDTAQVIEFQVKDNSTVRAIITLPNTRAKKVVGAFTVKPERYCVGLKLESMVTRK